MVMQMKRSAHSSQGRPGTRTSETHASYAT